MGYILALDQGTTSSRAILFDREGQLRGVAQAEFEQLFPQPGWVEHDPEEIWQTQHAVARQVLSEAGVPAGEIHAIGITNQRETTVVWDRVSGNPIANAIVWQDRRTADVCRSLSDLYGEAIRQRTGLIVDAYFSASKIKWILENIPGARSRAERGELACGTIDSWLLWRLTNGRLHATDVSNASRTMLYNIHEMEWDPFLLDIFEVPPAMLPEVRPSSYCYGETDAEHFGAAIPITGIAGDQQAALFGQNCVRPGMVKNTYGTGCFLMMNTGTQAATSRHRLLTTLAWQIGAEVTYALEGSIFIGGAVVQWLRDGLGLIRQSHEVEALARSVADTGGVYLVPAFAGLGAPHWDPYARGTIVGMTRGTTSAHLARAALESIAFQTMDVMEAMHADAGMTLDVLRVDGGAATNELLMQIQTDLLQLPVVLPRIRETTALGAAYLAGLSSGFWKDLDEISTLWTADRSFRPQLSPEEVGERSRRWRAAIERAKAWEQ